MPDNALEAGDSANANPKSTAKMATNSASQPGTVHAANRGNRSGVGISSTAEASGGGGNNLETTPSMTTTNTAPTPNGRSRGHGGGSRRGRGSSSSSRMPPGEATSASAALVQPPAPVAQSRALVPLNSTLADARTTPRLARLLLPLLMLATHGLFYYGQTAPMWKLRVFAHIDTWANATDFQAKTTFNTLGLDHELHFGYDEDKDMETFTYWYAIKQLWIAKGMPGKFLPRSASVLLVIFSGVWPHLKLFILQLTWFFGRNQMRRTRVLHWLSTLGKWSLADVLTVCVMVGVLHLDWDVDPGAIKHGVIDSLPDIMILTRALYDNDELCDYFLKMECATQKNLVKQAKCSACNKFLSEAYTHPDWAKSTGRSILRGVDTSGGGVAALRVVGMAGIYAFCGAVILSILWSVVVDIFDHKARQDQTNAMQYNRRIMASTQQRSNAMPTSSNPCEGDDGATENLQEPLLISNHLELEVDGGLEEEEEIRRGHQANPRRLLSRTGGLFSLSYIILAIAAAYVVLLAVDLPTMDRQVHGAGPLLLHDILGVNWERTYSLFSLMSTTGGAGGWDLLLMGTFSLFCVFGPILRSGLCIVVAILDKSSALRRTMVEPVSLFINFLGAFCAWEVFVIAILMVQMLMPSITNTIIQKPFCAQISDDGSCLQVEFNVLSHTFVWIVVGGFFLLGASSVAVRQGVHFAEDMPSMADTSASGRGHYTLVNDRIGSPLNDNGLEEVVFERQQV